jgi:hypothetical protein
MSSTASFTCLSTLSASKIDESAASVSAVASVSAAASVSTTASVSAAQSRRMMSMIDEMSLNCEYDAYDIKASTSKIPYY